VVAILGTTYTGEFEPIEDDPRRVVATTRRPGSTCRARRRGERRVRRAVPAPELEWDFRLPTVKSINVSGTSTGCLPRRRVRGLARAAILPETWSST
jgi:glutamate decarboxylase